MARASSEAQRAYQREYYQRRKAEKRAHAGGISGPCCYCGQVSDALTVEHIIPRSMGGNDGPGNLRAACRWCNLSRGHRDIETWRAAIARRIAGVPAFGVPQREYLMRTHGIDVYRVTDAELSRIIFAFEAGGRASDWRSKIMLA